MSEVEMLTTPDAFGDVAGSQYDSKGTEIRVVKNGEASAALAEGDVVIYDTTAADGVTVIKATTLGVGFAAGVVTEDIVAGSYGRIVVYGVTTVKVDGGTTDVAVGDLLVVASGARAAAGTAESPARVGVALAAHTTGTGTASVFVKTLGV